MTKKVFLSAATLLMALVVLFLAGILIYKEHSSPCSNKSKQSAYQTLDNTGDEGALTVYNKNGVRVVMDKSMDYDTVENEEVQVETSIAITYLIAHVYDESTEIATLVSNVSMAAYGVDAVNEKNIIVHIIREIGSISDVFVINRQTHKVTHYWFDRLQRKFDKEFMAITTDAKKLVGWGGESGDIAVYETSLGEAGYTVIREVQHASLKKMYENGDVGIALNARMSPDDRYVAFIGESGGDPSSIIADKAYIYDMGENTVIKMGDIRGATGELVWKDNKTFIHVTKESKEDGTPYQVEREVFTVEE